MIFILITFFYFVISISPGKYIFIEATGRKIGDKARLSSEQLNKMSNRRIPYCLRFWYHMMGSGVGTLNLMVKTCPGSTNEKITWQLSGNQGNKWREGTAPIYSRYDFYVSLKSIVRTDKIGLCWCNVKSKN